MNQSPLLRSDRLTFYYPEQEQPTLREISLTVERGAFLVLCGPLSLIHI